MFANISPMLLTKRQREILDFIKEYLEKEGIPPSVREICERFGLKSPASVHKILKNLEKKGVLSSKQGKKRSWLPIEPRKKQGRIPVLGTIAAGQPLEAQENLLEELPVDESLFGCHGCFGLYVKGDSMIDLHITDGDIAIIKPCNDVEDGEIAAVMVDDLLTEATLKIVKKKPGQVELHAANPAYPPLVFKGQEAEKITILGSLAGIIRRRK